MCYNCGCLIPDDDMGDSKNITESTLVELAKKKNMPLQELKLELYTKLATGNNLDEEYEAIFSDASKALGQKVEDAKKETKRLLARQLR